MGAAGNSGPGLLASTGFKWLKSLFFYKMPNDWTSDKNRNHYALEVLRTIQLEKWGSIWALHGMTVKAGVRTRYRKTWKDLVESENRICSPGKQGGPKLSPEKIRAEFSFGATPPTSHRRSPILDSDQPSMKAQLISPGLMPGQERRGP